MHSSECSTVNKISKLAKYVTTLIPFFFINDSSPVMFATAWRIWEGGICSRNGFIRGFKQLY